MDSSNTTSAAARPEGAEAALTAARQAWAEKVGAEYTLARLSRYSGMSPGMKADQARASAQLSRAQETLQSVLGGAL